jgi:hypothetical protein
MAAGISRSGVRFLSLCSRDPSALATSVFAVATVFGAFYPRSLAALRTGRRHRAGPRGPRSPPCVGHRGRRADRPPTPPISAIVPPTPGNRGVRLGSMADRTIISPDKARISSTDCTILMVSGSTPSASRVQLPGALRSPLDLRGDAAQVGDHHGRDVPVLVALAEQVLRGRADPGPPFASAPAGRRAVKGSRAFPTARRAGPSQLQLAVGHPETILIGCAHPRDHGLAGGPTRPRRPRARPRSARHAGRATARATRRPLGESSPRRHRRSDPSRRAGGCRQAAPAARARRSPGERPRSRAALLVATAARGLPVTTDGRHALYLHSAGAHQI